jgi:uncharacterized protein (DUF1015 family)
VTDAATIEDIRAAVASGPLVLADGHHRFETAIAARDERRAGGTAVEGDDRVMCLVVPLAEDELWVQPIHRVLTRAPDPAAVRAALSTAFTVEELGPNEPETVEAVEARLRHDGGAGLVDATGVAYLRADPAAIDTATQGLPAALREVPTARFETMAGPALVSAGLDEHDIEYRADAATVAALVAKGAADAAILLPAVTVEQIRAAALAGLRMPQKTTYFAPKPRSGLVYRLLDD